MSTQTWVIIIAVIAIVGAVTLAFALRLVFKLWSMRKMLATTGASGKFAFWGALAYTIFPIDILPDPIYLDDMVVLGAALAYLTKVVRKQGSLEGAVPHARKVAEIAARRRAPR
jgi:uncharacterized membrane protein YkvA (DUF1232 family)